MNLPVYTHVCPLSPDRKFTSPSVCAKLRQRAKFEPLMPGRRLCLSCQGPRELAQPIAVEGLAPLPALSRKPGRGSREGGRA